MKNIFILILSFTLIFSLSNCNSGGKTDKTSEATENITENQIPDGKIAVYYFHNERRCVTCVAVEDVTKATLNEQYSEKMKSSDIIFESINIEDEANNTIVEKYQITGQTLLFVSGDKKVDLTNDAFMYAKDTPEKFSAKIKEAIDKI